MAISGTRNQELSERQPIAVMVEEASDVEAFASFTIEDAGGDKKAAAPPKEEAANSSEPADSGSGTAPPAASEAAKESKPSAQESQSTGGKLQTTLEREAPISPYIKSLAFEKGVPLKDIKGTGSHGKVTEEDIKKYKPATPAGGAPTAGTPSYDDIPTTAMRRTIANRLTESMNQNPHYFVASTVSVAKLLKLRQALNESAGGRYKLSVNDFFIKACAVACRKVPAVNSSWRGDTIRQYDSVDVSVAVATPAGLMTPIVRGVDRLGLETISTRVKELAKRAKDGKLKPEQYQGGTFAISNMGMNTAVERFTAVINPPQAGILAVGTVKKAAIPLETEAGTEVGWDEQITVTASFDHKVVDGAVGAEWIREFKKVVEHPLELIL